MRKHVATTILASLLFPLTIWAQESDRTGLNYGFHIGWQWAGNAEAKLYEVGSEGTLNLNTILIGNTTNYTKLKEYFNDDFSLYEFPHDTKYKPTLSLGGTLQYYTRKTFAVYLNAIFLSPSITHCSFSVKLNSKKGSLSDEVIEQGSISGKENRLQFEVGIHKSFPIDALITPFIEVAGAASFMEMKTHEISIGNLNQSVLHYSNDDANSNFSKVGLGTSCATGIQLPLANKFYLYAGFSVSAIHYGIFDNALSFAKAIDVKVLL